MLFQNVDFELGGFGIKELSFIDPRSRAI